MSGADTPSTIATLERRAAEAMRRRDFTSAVRELQGAAEQAPGRLELWLALAAAHRASGELSAALRAVDRALQREPRAFPALLMRASLLERIEGVRAAAPVYGAALLQAPSDDHLDEAARRALAHAREVNSRHGAELNTALRASLDALPLSGRAQQQAEVFVDRLTGRRRVYAQAPLGYAYPGLPAIEFWDRAQFPWLEPLEAAAPAIAAEMLAIGMQDAALVPYMDLPDTQPVDQWAELNRSHAWTAFHLYQHGRRSEANCTRCPHTLAALEPVPQPDAVNRSPSAMFSVLKARTRIPPHTGVSNTRLVGHLALSVPPGCGFRVGAETRAWREGCAWVFDDTIEHEAWNDSDTARAVLIFDVRHPLIPDEEHAAIAAIMAAMDLFSGAPSVQTPD
ncbi:aspartyl/asparaginyl beta-hydroxylase domain-containing protein [Caulobacter sp. S45]|uniref:aspartyl/asparaginyl beta-hydroxylase domain-containing protein n=1 Tax=Caulobacter sp. S45 TaxID=1641861 RepID=UPI0015775FC2|nr:aspartyl/asparaginyl beta-hydroxylase domain-containing protein [Caulobacter sp. S45]